jgi:hypothetical protein
MIIKLKSSIIIPRRRKYTHPVADENAVINILTGKTTNGENIYC